MDEFVGLIWCVVAAVCPRAVKFDKAGMKGLLDGTYPGDVLVVVAMKLILVQVGQLQSVNHNDLRLASNINLNVLGPFSMTLKGPR